MSKVSAVTLELFFVAFIVCLILVASPIHCQIGPTPPPAPAPSIPWWAPFAGLGLSAGLAGLQHIPGISKIPAWTVPFINVGLGLGVSWLGGHGITPIDPSTYGTTAVISGTAFAAHSVVKNAVRGDDWGTGSTPIK